MIWVDWLSMGLPIFPNPCFGPNEPGLCSGCYRGAWVCWARERNTRPISLSLSVAPQPLCTDCVGKGCNYSCDGCYFHVSARINPDRRHTWCVNDDPLGLAPVFNTLLFFLIS